MSLLMSATINEWVKLRARKKTVFFLALIAVLPFLGLMAVQRLQNGVGIAAFSGADYPIAFLGGLTLFVLPLLIFLSASDMFAGELGDRTIRSVLVRPVNRYKIFASKLLAIFGVTALGLLLGWISSTAASLFMDAPDGRWGGVAESALAYAAAAVPMFALGTVSAFLSLGFRNASGALAVSILVYAAAKLVAFAFPQIAAFLPTAYTDWHQLWIGGAVSFGKIAAIFSFLLGCGIVFYTSGSYLFEKKEV
ncbi:ABC transporter permease [Cohnella caldifontis]|uniref:ABC transporter permease n=1 Tax=Cohnella caldifontis TaxID=3027471 RepID=UPI0023EC8255|nr:ABC transporter permease [Cohnella sp. YIM B05605]